MKQLPNNYTKVGRLSQPVAKAIRRKAANIYIDDNHLRHIFLRHQEELAAIFTKAPARLYYWLSTTGSRKLRPLN
ncbi:MAG: hypothetical protein LBN98_01450 [Prevotellaceae bacterium]|jgi:hypothetical protein|nr:hypothetical protein [Prevotellaceae bacterium]